MSWWKGRIFREFLYHDLGENDASLSAVNVALRDEAVFLLKRDICPGSVRN